MQFSPLKALEDNRWRNLFLKTTKGVRKCIRALNPSFKTKKFNWGYWHHAWVVDNRRNRARHTSRHNSVNKQHCHQWNIQTVNVVKRLAPFTLHFPSLPLITIVIRNEFEIKTSSMNEIVGKMTV